MSEAHRFTIKQVLYNSPFRKVVVDGEIHICEGQAFRPHICAGGTEMNEVLIPRRVFQFLPEKDQEYFADPINCSLNCSFFHTTLGHTREFRKWFFDRMCSLYGIQTVKVWYYHAPLKGDVLPGESR